VNGVAVVYDPFAEEQEKIDHPLFEKVWKVISKDAERL
jgi:hypothetical protein